MLTVHGSRSLENLSGGMLQGAMGSCHRTHDGEDAEKMQRIRAAHPDPSSWCQAMITLEEFNLAACPISPGQWACALFIDTIFSVESGLATSVGAQHRNNYACSMSADPFRTHQMALCLIRPVRWSSTACSYAFRGLSVFPYKDTCSASLPPSLC